MKTLGIDYGRKKIGLAIAEGKLAEPYKVIHNDKDRSLFKKIKEIVKSEDITRIVIGISEGRLKAETKKFGKILKENLGVVLEYWDETLTTKEANRLSIQAGIRRQKRKSLEDAFAAALMLQSFIDQE